MDNRQGLSALLPQPAQPLKAKRTTTIICICCFTAITICVILVMSDGDGIKDEWSELKKAGINLVGAAVVLGFLHLLFNDKILELEKQAWTWIKGCFSKTMVTAEQGTETEVEVGNLESGNVELGGGKRNIEDEDEVRRRESYPVCIGCTKTSCHKQRADNKSDFCSQFETSECKERGASNQDEPGRASA
jgi:hypothetical protein